MNQQQLITLGTAILMSVVVDTMSWLRSVKEATEAGKPQPAWSWHRLAERVLAGVLVGFGASQIPGASV